jgi:hypothetical protein
MRLKALITALVTALLAVLTLCVSPTAAFAEPDTTIAGLTNAGQQLNGQKVTIQGEAVGDILAAESGYKWLTLRDGGASISVLVDEDDAAKVTRLGRYGQTGTRLEVTGVFEADCPEHDGLTDVHATKVVIIDEGSESASRLNVTELQVGGLLIIIGLCLLVLHRRLRERTR